MSQLELSIDSTNSTLGLIHTYRQLLLFGHSNMEVLFTIGSNGSGQLGIGHKEDVSVPKQALFHPEAPNSPIVKVAAGGNHTLLLTQDGQVHWSGDGTSGACGTGPVTDVPVFQKIVLGQDIGPVALVAASWETSYLVSKDASGKQTKLYSLGMGNKGELGVGQLIVRTPTATLFKDFPPADTEIVDISSSMGHAVIVLSNGDVYGWGNGRKGQVGQPGEVIYSPRKITNVEFKVTRVACAKESTALFGLPSSGEFKVIGSDKWNLTSGAPEKLASWKDVGASWGNIYVLTTEGSLVGWGRDDHGQLPPPNLPVLSKIAIGSEHAVALTEAGEVLAWGWGEHGNCGPKTENNDVKGRWSVIASSKYIPPDSQIAYVGAGCATSWIYITQR